MKEHTYAGHTLAEIREAAETLKSAPNGSPTRHDMNHAGLAHARQLDREGNEANSTTVDKAYDNTRAEAKTLASLHAAITPATVLAMVARIEELERIERKASCSIAQKWHALSAKNKARWLALTLGKDRQRCQGFTELEQKPDAPRLEGWPAAREQAAKTARKAPITRHEINNHTMAVLSQMSAHIDDIPPAAWSTQKYANCVETQWPHPDGFAGGLTERA